MKKAIVYTRFSPRKNASESESCEVQRDYCAKYAAANGYEVVEYVDDPDVSGADEYREKLWYAVKSLNEDWTLIVYKRDRLARDVWIMSQIERMVLKQKAVIRAVSGDTATDTPEDVLRRHMLDVIAEYERKLIANRTRAAMRFHQKNGRRMGAECPYGWKTDPDDPKRMVPNEIERDAIEVIRSWHAGGMAYNAIANKLNREYLNAYPPRHAKWNVKTVRKLCLAE